MIQKIVLYIQKEWRLLLKYLFVGGSSFFVKIGSYTIFSRFLQPQGVREIQNIEAIAVAVIYNYTLHRLWTFRGKKPAPGSTIRYATVVGISVFLDAGLFFVFHSIFKIYDAVTIVVVGVIMALYGFLSHTFFTFHHDPLRRNGGSKE
ncbi:MAG: GtrA family protein [bacterium]|nr:GtrA family protein [bacterium]